MEILRTTRLRLREFTPDDASFIVELVNDPDWHRYINDPGVRDVQSALTWMESRLFEPYRRLGHGFWAVERIADGELLGMCGIFKRDSLPEVDLGYGFLARHRGHGYAREAAEACLCHGHEAMGLTSMLAITDPENTASMQLLLKIGMQDEGLIPKPEGEPESRLFRWTAAV